MLCWERWRWGRKVYTVLGQRRGIYRLKLPQEDLAAFRHRIKEGWQASANRAQEWWDEIEVEADEWHVGQGDVEGTRRLKRESGAVWRRATAKDGGMDGDNEGEEIYGWGKGRGGQAPRSLMVGLENLLGQKFPCGVAGKSVGERSNPSCGVVRFLVSSRAEIAERCCCLSCGQRQRAVKPGRGQREEHVRGRSASVSSQILWRGIVATECLCVLCVLSFNS